MTRFRRAVTAEDVKPFVALVRAKLARGYTFERALRVGLLGVMVSPEFLFLREKPGQLDDFALAGRLSYFLWSTMPDEELLAVADGASFEAAARVAERKSGEAVAHLVARFNRDGIDALVERHGGGQPRHYIQRQQERILQAVR